ncbi:MAG: Eco29kI family restriction endonuclease [Thermoflexales bacterium]|nr:Eco29kI family restriction endonuclease [Thermoflexales bacterium]
MSFDYNSHIFRSPHFISVVDEAIEFFVTTSMYTLPPPGDFVGNGVYALYYTGDYGLYARLSALNKVSAVQPIYVGKAVPHGWRAARSTDSTAPVLYRRLLEHARGIEQAENLCVGDFSCRFMILEGVESDLVVPVEAALIRRYKPLWNSVVDGFGNHDPGKGRYNQARSEWDVLHPGRPWARRLTGPAPHLEEIVAKLDTR